MSHSHLLTAAAAALLATPLSVLAHDGHGASGLAAGFAHPFSGLDHLMAIVAIGGLAGLLARRQALAAGIGRINTASTSARIAMAACLGLAAGILAAVLGVRGLLDPVASVGLAEQAVVIGLLAMAVMVLRIERLNVGAVGIAALLVLLPHGYLHGTAGSGTAFFAGLALASLALFALGLLVGRAIALLPQARARSARLLMAASLATGSGWFMAFGAS
jgi:urease accessory protein